MWDLGLLGKWDFKSPELLRCFQMLALSLVLSRIQGELKNIQFNCVGVKPFLVFTGFKSTREAALCLIVCFVNRAYGSEVKYSILRSELLNQISRRT